MQCFYCSESICFNQKHNLFPLVTVTAVPVQPGGWKFRAPSTPPADLLEFWSHYYGCLVVEYSRNAWLVVNMWGYKELRSQTCFHVACEKKTLVLKRFSIERPNADAAFCIRHPRHTFSYSSLVSGNYHFAHLTLFDPHSQFIFLRFHLSPALFLDFTEIKRIDFLSSNDCNPFFSCSSLRSFCLPRHIQVL